MRLEQTRVIASEVKLSVLLVEEKLPWLKQLHKANHSVVWVAPAHRLRPLPWCIYLGTVIPFGRFD